MRLLGFSAEGALIYTTLVAVLGAVLLIWVYRRMTAAKT